MSLLNDVPSISSIQDSIRNPFSKNIEAPFRGEDFPEGFVIEELFGEKRTVELLGNLLPKIPFTFGGKQRIKKDYYAGSPEPTTQVLGSEENNITLNGTLKDKRYFGDDYYGASTEIQKKIDSLRISGQLCKFTLGEWERYGFIEETSFDMRMLSNLDYSITLLIVGFQEPTNARFIEKRKAVPFDLNEELIDGALGFQEQFNQIPESVPQSISDIIDGLTSAVATEINKVTGLVDTVISTVGDVQGSIQRVLGLVKTSQNKLRSYQRFVGAIDPFDTSQFVQGGLTGRYEQAAYYSSALALAASLASLLNSYRDQFRAILDDLPLGRHFVRDGDTLQKISNKFYETPENWKDILDYNDLTSTDLELGKILEIPRI